MANQQLLFKKLRLLFPSEKFEINARKATQLQNPSTKMYREIDIWCPNLGLCFEFQDHYHYETSWYSDRSISMIASEDYTKMKQVRDHKLELVVIPCWWNGKIGSLQSTIHFQLPHVLERSKFSAISLNPPPGFFKSAAIPGVCSKLMNVSFVINSNTIKLNQWWLGEKYDGIRFCYSGTQLYSRRGSKLYFPHAHYSQLPKLAFDGEIWFGRANYVLAHQMIFQNPEFSENLRMVAFDYPMEDKHHVPIELRFAILVTNLFPEHPFIEIPSRLSLPSPNSVKEFVKCITDDCGEGIILQQQGSHYIPDRSQSLLKFKPTIEDKEALVVKVTEDCVLLKLPSGKVFRVLTQNVMVSRLESGDIVTFSSEAIYKHTPVHAVIHRKRVDLTWKDVLQSTPISAQIDSHEVTSSSFSPKKMRTYLENFATKQLLDPAIAKTWYMLREDITSLKHGKNIIRFYGNYTRAIQQLFPETSFDTELFDRLYIPETSTDHRAIFEKFAKTRGFNPNVAHNWYKQNRADMVSFKIINDIVTRDFGNNMPRALVSLFPDLKLDVTLLFDKTRIWSDPELQKKQFEKFALTNGFNPLCAESWYSQKGLRHYPGIRAIMRHHGNNLIQALISSFPNIGLKPTLFTGWRKWSDPKNRRQFFLDYAAKVGIDPLNATSWYSQNLLAIRNTPGGNGVLFFHGKSIAKALVDLFPEVEFSDTKKFKKHTKSTSVHG